MRVTYNRDLGTFSSNVLFGDTFIGAGGVDPFGYELRNIGIPKSGWNFRRDCEDGFCMRSEFVNGGTANYVAADATLTWDFMTSQFSELAGVPAPNSSQVGTDLRLLDQLTRIFNTVNPEDVVNVEQLRRTVNNTVEVGYKGILGDRASVGVDVFLENRHVSGRLRDLIVVVIQTRHRWYATVDETALGEASVLP